MTILRVIIAVIIFSMSSYFIYDLFANEFDWGLLLCGILGFILAHYLWPKKQMEDSSWFDILEFIIDLPYRSMTCFIRSIGRGKNDSFDLDIDL